MNPKHQHVSKDNRAAKNSLKQLQIGIKRLQKMGLIVLSYRHDEMHLPPIIEVLPNQATAGLIALGKVTLTNQGVDAAGKYAVYGMMLGMVYVRFTQRGGR